MFREDIEPITEITEENAPTVIKFLAEYNSAPTNFMRKLLMFEVERLEKLSKKIYKKKIDLYKDIIRKSISNGIGGRDRPIRKKDRKYKEIVDGQYE